MKRFRGGLVCKAHRLVYHPNLGSRVIKKKRRTSNRGELEEDVEFVEVPALLGQRRRCEPAFVSVFWVAAMDLVAVMGGV